MDRPTRQEQARAILQLRGWQLASQVLGRRATNAADLARAFNLERIDLITEIAAPEELLRLGRNRPGPSNGLYVLDDGDSYRVYIQEDGEELSAQAGLSFEAARDAVIDRLIQLGGLPFTPPG